MKPATTSITWKGNPDLRALLVGLDELHQDPANARIHPAENLEHIKSSYASHGQQKPVVATRDGKVLAGNGQYAAAKVLDWTHIAVVRFESDDPALQAAFAIADNRSGESSKWDTEALVRTLQSLPDTVLPSSLYSPADLTALLASEFPAFLPTGVQDQDGLDQMQKPLKCPNCNHEWLP